MDPLHNPALTRYLRKFSKLTRGQTAYGKAPHKPILLLTLIELVEKEVITDNRVFLTPELVATFKENFALLAEAGHNADFTQPFFYLKSEGFWHLQPKPGYQLDVYIRSVQTLNERLDYAYFNADLYDLLTHTMEGGTYPRLLLKQALLDTYFPDRKADFLRLKNAGRSYLHDLQTYLLNEANVPGDVPIPADDEETRFVRGSLFKKLVPQVYDYTCAISGLRVVALDGTTLVEACHIVPFSISGDDRVTNGLSLCPTLHTAFDRGLIGIDDRLRVVVSPTLAENRDSSYNLSQFDCQHLLLPHNEKYYPSREAFTWHLQEKFNG